MQEYCKQNKIAWEYDAYDFWVKTLGQPEECAKQYMDNPKAMLKRYADYFECFEGVKVANVCGSCGKKAIPLALLGADVTVFDISEENKRYALETADAAGVRIEFVACDILEMDLPKYEGCFDVAFMEGGILHYFHDINQFMKIISAILKQSGKMICSDFHPFTKIMDALDLETPEMSYFSKEIYEGEMAHARFYEDEIRARIPKCSYRKYTISEIINSMIDNGFVLKRFDEHPSWENEKLPGEFTAIAIKN